MTTATPTPPAPPPRAWPEGLTRGSWHPSSQDLRLGLHVQEVDTGTPPAGPMPLPGAADATA